MIRQQALVLAPAVERHPLRDLDSHHLHEPARHAGIAPKPDPARGDLLQGDTPARIHRIWQAHPQRRRGQQDDVRQAAGDDDVRPAEITVLDANHALAEGDPGRNVGLAKANHDPAPHLEGDVGTTSDAPFDQGVDAGPDALAMGAPQAHLGRNLPNRKRSLCRRGGHRHTPIVGQRIKLIHKIRATLDFKLTDEQRMVRDTVRDFARKRVAPAAEELDRTKSFPYEIVAELAELGLMGIPFPEEYGGGGGDTLTYALAVEELARIDSSVAITMAAHTSLGTMPIYLFGSSEQKADWLPELTAGRKLAAFGLTEPDAGSDAGNTRTNATLDEGEWVIDGAKQFITNAGTEISGCVTITAVTGGQTGNDAGGSSSARKEISNLIVPNGTPGYEPGEPYRKMGWNASDTRPLSFDSCRVPESSLLGPRGAGFKQFMQILDGGRIGVAAMAVGLAQGALDEAIAYAKERQAFGKPIGKFQAIQAKVADISAQLEAARLLTYRAALQKDAGESFTLTAAQAKLITGRLAVRACEEAVQIHGGYGFIEEYPVCRFYRDAKILTIGEGTDEVQHMVIARQLGL